MSQHSWSILDERSQLKELKRFWKKYPNDFTTFTAFKYVSAESHRSPQRSIGIIYTKGQHVSVSEYDSTDNLCGAGINVATLIWCLKEAQLGIAPSKPLEDVSLNKGNVSISDIYHIIRLRCIVSDIVSIPKFTDGKFRVKAAYVCEY